MKNSLDYWLDEISVIEIDNSVNEANKNGLTAIIGWFGVINESGIIAYFGKENDAFRFRLDYINRKLNP